ncbi:UDP-glycosyltransferase 83A1 [Camellia lanceoleosa]|uniref:UDP-glycosyltransferase 83A1 n=1 Tax=Camellia lanceoleosa TaxID=1840588 RepID=A0ACC0HXR0_9ERIC|nr:UDP-glycosyltransferase 83A1 [Camellia lanceoleosa]
MQWLSKQGFKVTFVNTEFNHTKVLNSPSNKQTSNSFVVVDNDNIDLVSIPDGLEPWEDRNDFKKLIEAISQVMPGKLEEFIKNINNGSDEDEKISCVIADENIGWTFGCCREDRNHCRRRFGGGVRRWLWHSRFECWKMGS